MSYYGGRCTAPGQGILLPSSDNLSRRELIKIISISIHVPYHDVGIGSVSDKNKLSIRVSEEDLVQQEFSDRQCGRDITKIQRSRVKAASGVVVIDELHVIFGDLLGGCGEVVKVHFGEARRPIGVVIRHVHPLPERVNKGVVETLCRLIDFGDTENVINVTDDCHTLGRHQVGGCIPFVSSACIHIKPLWWSSRITR